jgi:GNAT superfamily N-acetyltransferase
MYVVERNGDFELSTDPARLDRALIHRFLSEQSYWAPGVPRAVVDRSIEHSLCFGVYRAETQVAFARVVTDRATFAYLADVFVLPEWRDDGLGQWMISVVLRHPELQGLRRFQLVKNCGRFRTTTPIETSVNHDITTGQLEPSTRR